MDSLEPKTSSRPHAVCIPFPVQGHIKPMLKLAKLLHQKGFHITFVNTEYNHRRLLKSRGPESLNGLPTFRFETIPDGLPPSDTEVTQEATSICYSTRENCLAPFRDLLSKLNNESNSLPVTCIVSDGIMSFTLKASQELGIPNVSFWTASACGFVGYLRCRQLIEKGFVPLKDSSYLTNGYLETIIDWIPGMEGISLKNLPSHIRTTDPNDFWIHYALGEVENAPNASAVIFHTFHDLEHEVLQSLSTVLPSVYTIGPLDQLVRDQVHDPALDSMGSSLWKEEPGCLEWLDAKPTGSVVYVNFGSVTVITAQQLVEFAWGLANSKQNFLWVIRPDLVGGETAIVPAEFVAETKERGLLASWCAQEQVLRHPSIAGFLTHCGWNSMLESFCSGVPMICWPFLGDQQTNSWFCCNKWGTGIEIDSDVKRSEIESVVNETVRGERGKAMKKKAMEWKKLAEDATASPSGSSYLNLHKMIDEVLVGDFSSYAFEKNKSNGKRKEEGTRKIEKPLQKRRFETLRNRLGMQSINSKEERSRGWCCCLATEATFWREFLFKLEVQLIQLTEEC